MQRELLLVRGIERPLSGKRHVGDRQIKEVVRPTLIFKSANTHVRRAVQRLGDLARNNVELNRRPVCSATQFGGHHADEVANASRRLQRPAALEAHMLQSVPHATDNLGRSVVRVGDRCAGGGVLAGAQQILDLVPLSFPLGLVVGENVLGEGAPADILDENALVLLGHLPAGILDVAQRANCRNVGAHLGLGPALADLVGIGDLVVQRLAITAPLIGLVNVGANLRLDTGLLIVGQPFPRRGWCIRSAFTISRTCSGIASSAFTLSGYDSGRSGFNRICVIRSSHISLAWLPTVSR